MRLNRSAALALPLSLLLGALAGCGKPDAAAPAPADTPAAPTAPTAADTATAEPTQAQAAVAGAKPTHPGLVVDTVDHGRFDLAEKRGQWVVVNFWATWCAPCLKEIPDLNALDAKREDLQVIGLAYEEIDAAAMRAFYDEKVRPEYPVAIVDVYNPPADFDTPRGLPFTVLVDPEGRVAHQFLGPVTGADIEAKITELGAPAA